jgi:hypothetical protein
MALPTDLTANDAGFLLHIVDFSHLVRWTGASWEWAPGDEGNGYIEDFLVPPVSPGWQVCDGTITSLLIVGHPSLYSQSIQLPDEVTNGAYHKSAATVSTYTVQPAVAPLITGNTADESTHTHPVVVPDQNTANESAHTHSVDPPSTDSGDDSAQVTVDNTLAGSTVSVPAHPHHHTTDIGPFTSAAGSAHHHDVPSQTFNSGAGAAHHHAHGTLVNDALGEPKHVLVLRYFRR